MSIEAADVPDVPAAHAELLTRHAATEPWQRLGRGGEATVYALDGDRVLRVFHSEPWKGARCTATRCSTSSGRS